jgi:hypothetical protein
MPLALRIAGDPDVWTLGADAKIDVIQQDLINQDSPVTLNVDWPLKGRLVLSPLAVTSVAILTPPGGWIPGGDVNSPSGWIPGGGMPPPDRRPTNAIQDSALLYVPSPTGPAPDDGGYTLPESTDPTELENEIVTAMTDGTTISVEVTWGAWGGPLLLNGAALPFAVICPPRA